MNKLLLVLVVLSVSGVFFYQRDVRTIKTAQSVVSDVRRFCGERGRLPSKEEFAGMYPGLTPESEWYYWLMQDKKEVGIQYPMASSWHKDAPGDPKTSEFTATTYAYVARIKCSEQPQGGWPADPIACPVESAYRIRFEEAGAREWCEKRSGGASVKHGSYRSWFNRDLRLLMEQGDYAEDQKAGLWVECDRFKRCKRKWYGVASVRNVEYSNILANPYEELWEGEGKSQGLIRFFLDMDGDKEDEVFVGAKSLVGKSGGLFSIFKKVSSGYISLGEAFLYPGAFEVLPIRHNGFFDMRYCAGISAEQCELITFIFNGREYMRQDFKVSLVGELGQYGFASVKIEDSESALVWQP